MKRKLTHALLAAGALLLASPFAFAAADEGAAQAPEGYVVGPDGKVMDHSKADAKAMSKMPKGETQSTAEDKK